MSPSRDFATFFFQDAVAIIFFDEPLLLVHAGTVCLPRQFELACYSFCFEESKMQLLQPLSLFCVVLSLLIPFPLVLPQELYL